MGYEVAHLVHIFIFHKHLAIILFDIYFKIWQFRFL